MPLTYVHLSEIHFGQEKGADLIVHNDVKARLIEDAADQIRIHSGGVATGVIVTGDVAYGGKAHEYASAAAWLDCQSARKFDPGSAFKIGSDSLLMKLWRRMALVSRGNRCHAICSSHNTDPARVFGR
jgi:hypothetical protein